MSALNAEYVEQPNRVRDEVAQRVRRSTRLLADRLPGITVVVADDETPTLSKAKTKLILPSTHGSGRAVDQEDRPLSGIAEGLGA